jgi:hypothetical protein
MSRLCSTTNSVILDGFENTWANSECAINIFKYHFEMVIWQFLSGSCIHMILLLSIQAKYTYAIWDTFQGEI